VPVANFSKSRQTLLVERSRDAKLPLSKRQNTQVVQRVRRQSPIAQLATDAETLLQERTRRWKIALFTGDDRHRVECDCRFTAPCRFARQRERLRREWLRRHAVARQNRGHCQPVDCLGSDDVIRGFRIPPEAIQHAVEREGKELLRREEAYRDGGPIPDLTGKTVILVDDGLATGASMRAVIQAVREHGPARLVVAVPAAPESASRELAGVVDEFVCATTPSPFFAVGESYWDFTQTTDEEVRNLLRAAAPSRAAMAGERGPTDAAVLRSEAAPVEDGVPASDA
jgi:predicted phosphoribosyltransferase